MHELQKIELSHTENITATYLCTYHMHKSTLTLKIIDFKMADEKSSVSYKMNVNVKFLSYSAIKVII